MWNLLMLLKISQSQFLKLDRSIFHNSSPCRAELSENIDY